MVKNGGFFFVHQDKFMNYSEVYFSRQTFNDKAKKNFYMVFFLVDVGRKQRT